MALGQSSIYVIPTVNPWETTNWEDYFIGSIAGDSYTDDEYAAKEKRLKVRLAKIFGWGGFSMYWHSLTAKPRQWMTVEQKPKPAIGRAYSEHKRNVQSIIQSNTLFVDDYLDEETLRLRNRLDQLNDRYNNMEELPIH